MREWVRYLLWTVGGPLLILTILNAGLFLELWKLFFPPTVEPPAIEQIQTDQIIIPTIGITAPLTLSAHDPTAPWDDIRKDLERGVSMAPGLSRPGDEGTVWITGHSSDYAWRAGDFKTIFARLPALSPGDDIIVDYQGKRSTYRVTGREVVHPSHSEAFRDRGGSTLTLMTCYPPLTTARRWLTYAELQ